MIEYLPGFLPSVLLQTNVIKCFTHKNVIHALPILPDQLQNSTPVYALRRSCHQLPQNIFFFWGQHNPAAGLIQYLIPQVAGAQFLYIRRQIIHCLRHLLPGCRNRPNHKFNLSKFTAKHLYPARHATRHIRITTLTDQTYPHHSHSFHRNHCVILLNTQEIITVSNLLIMHSLGRLNPILCLKHKCLSPHHITTVKKNRIS